LKASVPSDSAVAWYRPVVVRTIGAGDAPDAAA